MYIPATIPTSTIAQVTSTISSIVAPTSDPVDTVPDIAKICSGQIFCVIYLSAAPWTMAEFFAVLRESAQVLVVAFVSIAMIL